jgi:NitT/TauT family transport system substrate-binding protein
MRNQYLLRLLVLGSFLSVLFLGACAQAPAVTPSSAPATLKIALLPIVDALPMYVAQKDGLFAAHGVNVEFIPAASAAQRDQIIVAGQADGTINDVVATLLFNKDQTQLQIVGFARTAGPNASMYRILAAKDSGITTPADLKGVPIGVSEGTVIAYMTDRLLQAEGLQADEIRTVAVPSISDRMTLLNKGDIKAATLPDPFFSLAEQQGAKVIVDDSQHPELSYSTIAFRKPVLDEHPEAVRGFLAAIQEATTRLNANPESYKSLLDEYKIVPPALLDSYKISPFSGKGVPSQQQYDDALQWAKSKGLISRDVPYADSVNASFLP